MNETDLGAASDQAEAALLGSLIIDRDAIASVVGFVKREAFRTWMNRTVYGAMLKLWKDRTPCDLVTLESTIRNAGVGEDQLPTSYLFSLSLAVPTAVHAPYYGEAVMKWAKRRAVIDGATAIVTAGYRDEAELDTTELVSTFRKTVEPFDVAHVAGVRTADAFAVDLSDTALARWNGDAEDPALPTRIPSLDRLLNGGLRAGQLVLIGARPSMGKTAIGVGLALSTPSHFVSLEMTAEEIGKRAIAQIGDVAYAVADDKIGDVALRSRWLEAADDFRKFPITINDRPRQTTGMIEADVTRLVAERGVRVVVIDHLDFLGDRFSRDNGAEQRTAELVHRCKALARACGVTVVLLAQLNRAVEHRDGYYPQLSDFRNSGAIEQDADVALMLRRRAYYSARGLLDPDEDADWFPGKVFQRLDVIVAKNRNGAIGHLQVGWKPDAMAIREVAA